MTDREWKLLDDHFWIDPTFFKIEYWNEEEIKEEFPSLDFERLYQILVDHVRSKDSFYIWWEEVRSAYESRQTYLPNL
jgi:hypothetical protein